VTDSNVERVKHFVEHFNRTGTPHADVLHPDAEWRAAREDPDAATHLGLDAIAEYFRQWTDMIGGLRVDLLEGIEAGERVFAWVRFSGSGTASGVDIEMEQAQVWTFRGRDAVRVEEYFDRAEGLAATGVAGMA
jgi:ketosteroid isomerase-like protein